MLRPLRREFVEFGKRSFKYSIEKPHRIKDFTQRRPNSLAALALIASSNFAGSWIGKVHPNKVGSFCQIRAVRFRGVPMLCIAQMNSD